MIDYVIQTARGFFQSGRHMYPILIVAIVGVIIQVVKVVIDLIRYKRFYMGHIFSSGGFPSFHSGLASSVTMLVMLDQGLGSVRFAVAFAFSLLFAYDAMNLRYEAGQHAQYINSMRFELQNVLQKKEGPLKERIGHTPWEVLGGIIFGSVLTYMLYYRFYLR
ncbi:MAG: divergent PAP2 family protein [Candidatus Absconditabacterales bacterium]